MISELKDSIEELKIDIINKQYQLDSLIDQYQELNNIEYDYDDLEEMKKYLEDDL